MRTPLLALLLSLGAVAAPAWALTFDEVADAAGVVFRHAATDTDEMPLNYPETTGSGACWGDVDLDGVDDLFLVNGRYSNATLQQRYDPRSALFLNDGDGTFTDASRGWGVSLSAWGQGCSFSDYDGDGDHDLLVVGYDMLRLFRNQGDRFQDVSAAANLSLEGKCGAEFPCFGEAGSWADYDLDGDLDLYVTNMVEYDMEEGGVVTPTAYPGQPNLLWRNRGDGTFEDVTAQAGVDDDPGWTHSKSFQSGWADYDRDGDPDLYIASDTTPNTLFRNNGDGTFLDVAAGAGVDDDRSSMGLVFQDVDADGLPDLFMTHYQGEENGFYTNGGDGTFTDRSGEGDLHNVDRIGWGTGFHDFDHDGDADIYAVNGHTTPGFISMSQKPRLWLQAPNGTFDEASDEVGPAFDLAFAGRGAAASDYDLDGDLDLAIIAMYNQTAKLFEASGVAGHWLQVEARQGGMNRFAIGAEVTVTPEGGSPATRVLQAGSSFLSQDSLVVHAGLGSAARADVQVRWPGGLVETWTGVDADQRVRLARGSPAVVRDTLAPRTTVLLDGEGRNGWFRGSVTVSLDVAERAMGVVSGVALREVRVDGVWSAYSEPFGVTGEGVYDIAGRSADAAGNQEPARVSPVRIDSTPPITVGTVHGVTGEAGWYRRAAGLGFAASDALSGVAQVWSRLDGGAWEPGASRVVDAEGEHTVDYYAEDVAGNAEAPQSVVVRVDRTPPTVAVRSWPLVVALGPGVVEVDAADAHSGVVRVEFWLDGEAAPRFVDLQSSDGWSWTFSGLAGVHVLRVVAVDGAAITAEDKALLLGLPPLVVPPLGLSLLALPLAARRR